jgi:hypothetical protein
MNFHLFIMKRFIFSLLLAGFVLQINAQTSPFNIYIEPISIPNVSGLQSYAFGQHDGKWLILGGRLDGLHRRQPFAAFDIAGHNTQLIVIDPVARTVEFDQYAILSRRRFPVPHRRLWVQRNRW